MPPFTPLYLRIKERIRNEIIASQEQGSRLPTERELESHFRVSRPTISKALTALAAEGVLAKAQGSGSFRIASPRRFEEENKTMPASGRLIGYVAPISNEVLPQRIFRGIDRAAQRENYCVLMGGSGQNVVREQAIVRELIAYGARGLVIYPTPRTTEEAVGDYLRGENLSVPVVLVDTSTPEQAGAQVLFNNRRVSYQMAAWLMQQGHWRIALLSYPQNLRHSSLESRMRGYQDALKDQGIAFDPALIRRHIPYADNEKINTILDELLALPQPPTAIIATEDVSAMQIIDLLRARKIDVPRDICVVGFDNRDAAHRFSPPFPTTNPDFETMGEIACNLLLEGLATGSLEPHTYILDVPLLLRHDVGSVRPAAVTR